MNGTAERLELVKQAWARVVAQRTRRTKARNVYLLMIAGLAKRRSSSGGFVGIHLPFSWNLTSRDRQEIKFVEQWARNNPDIEWCNGKPRGNFPHRALTWAWDWVQNPPRYGTSIVIERDWFDADEGHLC